MNVKTYSYLSILVCVVVGIVIIYTGSLNSGIGKFGLICSSAFAYLSIMRLRDLKKGNKDDKYKSNKRK
ncbi:hypothetical protein [Asaccharospora irregularis]|uniref:Uncharacterized protein n=1 Tax=Asaccharospora irregularis DSM 2635 TaxID=1121321 RepID=A0A1M5MP42_9FIRM|nr:hypothetical protein [Asaccharospora irregularis]SHG79078.1 hypothetical protein SAMN04488530_10795 [Asaccharospora irregularis DSM 2635]